VIVISSGFVVPMPMVFICAAGVSESKDGGDDQSEKNDYGKYSFHGLTPFAVRGWVERIYAIQNINKSQL